MTDAPADPTAADDFIRRWEASGAAERANYALFLTELCDLVQVPRPEPTRPDDAENAYVFERSVTFHNADGTNSVGRIDLYKRGCFILEAKQGSERPEPAGLLAVPKPARRKGTAVRGTAGWDGAMLAAKGQAEQYVKALPASEPNPPFLIVVDVGHTIELYTDFTRQGRTYTPFPDALTHRVKLRELAAGPVRERLRLAWTDPLSLDPSRRSAKVTREVAERLAKLAQSLERSGHTPEAVAQFLMRCLFTFFAEDAGLLPKEAFTTLLRSLRTREETALFPDMMRSLWETMKTGGFSPILRAQLLRFNGGLFESAEALPVTDDQLELLIQAGEKQWRDVEPAIFGTLLERALNPVERHKLGAHFTPRAYVERLVMPTIIEPLRDEWANVQTAAVTLANEGKLSEARDEVRAFLRKLCNIIILDPACGTGNFLYVTLEHMKILEGEILDALRGFGETQAAFEGFGLTVDPHQFLGIEINPRAAAIADLVLWIGYLQWHFRTYGNRMPAEPIIHAYHNIHCGDALIKYNATMFRLDENGMPITRWDGRTFKTHPITSEEVPDESARVPLLYYDSPSAFEWPSATYAVGNPPYIGNKRMRYVLGEGYVETVRAIYKDTPEASDYVMYWWHKAAKYVAENKLDQFGFITTNSIIMTFNKRTVESALAEGLSVNFAIPDHPWTDCADGAAVRVALTVASKKTKQGRLLLSVSEHETDDGSIAVEFTEKHGLINADLTIGANFSEVEKLKSNHGLASPGVQLSGQGFIVGADQLSRFTETTKTSLIKPYLIGNDILKKPRGDFALDASELSEADLISKYPDAYQWLAERVKPERDHNPRESYRKKWWIFSEPRARFKKALFGVERVIAICRTAKHRVFSFTTGETVAETTVVLIALSDSFHLGVLSSRVHEIWVVSGAKATLEDRPRYNVSVCFDNFPFPDCAVDRQTRIRELAEALDNHRRQRKAIHSNLSLTDVYNVLDKIRVEKPLSEFDKVVNAQGLITVLKQIHDDLDAAVFDAYGWPHDLTDEEILTRLVDLNCERADEESRGTIRWLRPEFQNPEGAKAARQGTLPIPTEAETTAAVPAPPAKKQPWPKSLAEQAQAVRSALASRPGGMTAEQLARTFHRAQVPRVTDLLETLVSLGQARTLTDGRYVRV